MEIKIYYCAWSREDGPESHDLLRCAIGRYLGGALPEEFTLCRGTEHGKPYVKELPEVHFSITHAGGFWACAVGGCETGLDLQDIRERETAPIAKRFFHPSEILWLKEHEKDEFFRIWAAKESYVKYTGKGLTEGLDWFSVVDGVGAWQREIPFAQGFRMVLTAAREAEIGLEELSRSGGDFV